MLNDKLLRAYPTYIDYLKDIAKKNTEDEEYQHIPRVFPTRYWESLKNKIQIPPEQEKKLYKQFVKRLTELATNEVEMLESCVNR